MATVSLTRVLAWLAYIAAIVIFVLGVTGATTIDPWKLAFAGWIAVAAGLLLSVLP